MRDLERVARSSNKTWIISACRWQCGEDREIGTSWKQSQSSHADTARERNWTRSLAEVFQIIWSGITQVGDLSSAVCSGEICDKFLGTFEKVEREKYERICATTCTFVSDCLLCCQFNNFTITAEIHARSLANFYCQYADRHMNLKFVRRVSERERAIRQFCYRKKQIDVSFLCVCPVIDHKFRHHIVKVAVDRLVDPQ